MQDDTDAMAGALLPDQHRGLDVSLHDPATRGDASALDALIHDVFQELGRFGMACTKASIVASLLAATAHATVVADRFALRRLGSEAALLTYRSAHRLDDGTLHRFTPRASIWQRSAPGWQMSFHQGAPTTPYEPEP